MSVAYTRERIGAREALELGLLSEVVSAPELQSAARKIIGRLTDRSRSALEAVKEYLAVAPHLDPAAASRYASALLSVVLSSKGWAGEKSARQFANLLGPSARLNLEYGYVRPEFETTEFKKGLEIRKAVLGEKAEGHLGRCYLKGRAGDAANAILSAIGYNFRRILAWLRIIVALFLGALSRLLPARLVLSRAS
jgi:hypothetical protein